MFQAMHKIVPEKEIGIAKIEHVEISEEQAMMANFRCRRSWEHIHPGKYVRLIVDGELMMSDTDMEKYTNRTLIRNAKGTVFIAGLGVGLVLIPLVQNKEVKKIVVIEKYKEVIDIVLPEIRGNLGKNGKKITVINEDVFEYKPEKGTLYDIIYFDIWPNICHDNREEANQLKRRYRKYLAKDGWMEWWSNDILKFYPNW